MTILTEGNDDVLVLDRSVEEKNREQAVSVSNIQDDVQTFANANLEKDRQSYKAEVLSSKELTEENYRAISDFYRYIFCNDWGDFLVCQDCDVNFEDGMRISANDFFGTGSESVGGSRLNFLPENCSCPNCKNEMKLFHDPKETYENIKKKLSFDGNISLLKDDDENIVAMSLAYVASLRDVFNLEWVNKYNYMDPEYQLPSYDRDFDLFLKKVNEAGFFKEVDAGTLVYSWSFIVVDKKVRGNKYFSLLMKNLWSPVNIPDLDPSILIFGYTMKGSKAHGLFNGLGAVDIPGVLEDDLLMVAGPLKTGLNSLKKFL